MYRTISQPSLGTIGNTTLNTSRSEDSVSRRRSGAHLSKSTSKYTRDYRGKKLWEGRWEKITFNCLMLPWNMWWQVLVMIAIVYKYTSHLVLAYIVDKSTEILIIQLTVLLAETIFFFDWVLNMLHAFWSAVRYHIRVYRRNYICLLYDSISLLFSPLVLLSYVVPDMPTPKYLFLTARWLVIGRIYRIFSFFDEINLKMRKRRFFLFLFENMLSWGLFLHLGTCIWYNLHKPPILLKPWYSLGYPAHVTEKRLKYDSYLQCFYYVAGRSFNTIFGDGYPMNTKEKVLTAFSMLVGFAIIKYTFIGIMAWEIVLTRWRWILFVDLYHHMMLYLKTCGAPSWLIEQAKNYKQELWHMKNGILTSEHLKELPHSLQIELIFDINVAYLHNSLLFRDTGEGYMRQVSLLMQHEIYLRGQVIWSQGVVKGGMFCIKRGVIEILSDEDDESPMIAFKDGTVLGESCLFYSLPSKVTVKAATYVELQTLKRTDFLRAMVENPVMLNKIRKKIDTRLRETIGRQRAIEAYDKGDSRLIRTRYRPMKLLKDRLAGFDDEDPTFIDDSHLYFKDANNIRKPKFTTEYLELYQLSHNVTTIDTPHICLNANFPWILEPDTNFTRLFDILHFITILYICIISPLQAIDDIESDFEIVLNYIVIAMLLFNIYLQLTTCIIDKGNRRKTVKEIAALKLSTIGFYLDVISVCPLYIFADSLDPRGDTMASELCKLAILMQVWHIWDYMTRWERKFESNVKFYCLCKYAMLLIIFCYWSGCFIYIYACPKRLCHERSWMARLIFEETKVYKTPNPKHAHPFTSALFFGTAAFTGSGTSNIKPGMDDLLPIICLVIVGSYFYSHYISEICAYYLLCSQRKLKFKESMRELFYFLSVNRVSSKIKARVKKFFIVQWNYNQAVSNKKIIMDMPANVKQEVLATEMVETLMYCPIFQDCSRDFIQTVASSATTVVLPDNEIIQHSADIGREMYIIQKGHCKLLDYNKKTVRIIGPGSHFGVIEMLYGLPKVYTVVTTTNCVLRHIEYSSLTQCWSTFPDSSHIITLTMQSQELKDMAAKYDEAKPMTGRLDNKTNRIAQEIKESFVLLRDHEDRTQYMKTFEKLGYLRFLRYIFLPMCITPYGIFLKIWCGLRIIFEIYYILVIPFFIAVNYNKHYNIIYWTDAFLYADVLVQAYVAYYNEKSLLITHPLLALKKYLKTTFVWDCICIFPFENVVQVINGNYEEDLYRINRLLLVTRIQGAFAFWEGDIVHVNQAVVMLKFIPPLLAFVNVLTAVIFMNSCTPVDRPTFEAAGSRMILVTCQSRLKSSNRDTVHVAFWEYLHTAFSVFEILLGSGCNTVTLQGKTDSWLMILMRIVGFLYFAFMFGYIATTCSGTSRSLLEHNENTLDLENFLYQENVDPLLTARTLKYFEYVWKRTNGSNPQKICRRLNSALMEDTLVFMYEHALREVPLFGKVERSFIRVIIQHLNEMYFLKGETVIQCRDMLHYIYIINRGKVDVLNSYNEMVSCMGPGGMFGNFTGQPISCSEVSIYASRSLDLLVIPSQTFFNLVKFYPKLQEPLTKAFTISKDYILPITMDLNDNSSDEEESDDDDSEDFDSRSASGSSRYDLDMAGQISNRSSQSSLAKSSVSVNTMQSNVHITNLIRPGTWLHQGYGYLTSLMATISYVITLYEIITMNNCQIIFWIQYLIDVYFYLKIYLIMHQGYLNKHGEMIVNTTKCRRRYFKHKYWLWADIIVNFPFELLGFCFPTPLFAMHYLRANKLLRLLYLIEFYRNTSAELTNNFTALQAATTILVVIILIHTGSCLWLITIVIIEPNTFLSTIKSDLNDAPIDEIVGTNESLYAKPAQLQWDYVTSFYMIVTELTSTGGDSLILKTMIPITILCLALVCGKMLSAMVIATAVQIAYSTKHALTKYERQCNELIDMLVNQGLSPYQTKKYWKYVSQLWISERGRQLPKLLSQTPYVRRCDLMSAMFGHHLRNCYLFSETGDAFLRQLTGVLEYTVFFPGNYIVTAGDSEAKMYWLTSGTVSVLSVRSDLTETTHEKLGPGDVFGILQGLTRGISHVFSYRAETKVSILTLSLDSWINILQFFPEAHKIITDRSEFLFTHIDI